MRTMGNNILIVDDDQMIIDFFSFILEMNGFRVHKASNAYEAMQILVTNRVDLCLSDIQMPKVDGYQLCKGIKEIYRDISVILWTADYSGAAMRKAKASGAVDCLSKSTSPEALMKKIIEVLMPEQIAVVA